MAGLWGELEAIAAQRERLDERELALIDRIRREGATWGQVATALGLASRQAAEQRRQRLAVAVDRALRSRRREQDRRYGEPIEALREAVCELCAAIRADGRWGGRFVRAALVRDTLTLAEVAEPGPMFALAAQAAADLGESGVEVLPGAVRDGVLQLRRAVKEAVSTKH